MNRKITVRFYLSLWGNEKEDIITLDIDDAVSSEERDYIINEAHKAWLLKYLLPNSNWRIVNEEQDTQEITIDIFGY